MAKKAKLDVLEIGPKEPEVDSQAVEAAAESGEGESSGEIAGGAILSGILERARRPLFRIILIVIVFLGLAVGIMSGFYQKMDEEAANGHVKRAGPAIPLPPPKPGAIFEGIVVDQKDEKGNTRIVFCDVAIEMDDKKRAGEVKGDRADARIAIYAVLNKEPAQEGLTPEGRGRLKEKLKSELNGLFGENLVKEVYFTRYEMD